MPDFNGAVLFELPEHRWVCPKCPMLILTPGHDSRTPLHECPGMKGLRVPMIPEGVKAKLVAVEREDYIGGEDVQYDGENRPIMNVQTVRDDGEDTTIYVPAVRMNLRTDETGVKHV